MSETKKAPQEFSNIKGIADFKSKFLSRFQKDYEAQRKRLEDAVAVFEEYRTAFFADQRAEEEKRQAKEKIQREQEEAVKKAIRDAELEVERQKEQEALAKAEALQLAKEASEAKEAKKRAKPEPVAVAETETAVSAPEAVQAVSEATAEPVQEPQVVEEVKAEATAPVIPQVAQEPPRKTTFSKTQVAGGKKEPIVIPPKPSVADEIKQAIIAPLFKTPKKQVIEKPVIRIYVPPVETERPRRAPYNPNQSAGGSAPAGTYQPRPQGAGTAPSGAPRPMGAGGMARPLPLPSIGAPKLGLKKKVSDKPAFDQKRTMDKKTLAKKGYIEATAEVEYDEISGEIKKIRTRKTSDKRKSQFNPITLALEHAVLTKEIFTIKELSEKIGKTGTEIIKQLFFLGIIKTINDTINFETAELVACELGITIELQKTATSEENLIAQHDTEVDDPDSLEVRPPVVTIMGHVDHGKTSILDYIRKANVASGEAGGITQHVGAYSITVDGSKITFLDTPGHEAFTQMRARGANVTDIAIIVVAADDGIMPQTIEAINHAKAANVTIIVAVNKMDKPTADPDRILTQLGEQGLVPEDWGGTIPVARVSAKTGAGIADMLSTILVTAEVNNYRANFNRSAKGTIIEANLDKGKGSMATVLVQHGTLKVGDYVVVGSVTGKIRAMQDYKGRLVKTAGPSMAVAILGLHSVPEAGDQLMVVANEKLMKEVAMERLVKIQETKLTSRKVTLEDAFKVFGDGKQKNLNLILKADVQGSVEAIKESLIKLSNEEVKVNIVHAVAGAINESDVSLADTTGAIIIGFNVRPDTNARALAEKNSIDIRLYRVIYDAIDDVTKAIKGLLAPKFREEYIGRAEIRQVFKIGGVGSIGGCMVKDGKIARNAKARLIRNNIVITESEISSLKRFKDEVKEVLTGFECGIGLLNYNDIKEGDIIESFNIVQEKV
ncbi:MAG: translation initiation factor IF-2 [Firmicutes bacterium]|nr:translation initiation factor IF-2 [Bacillota bacterium]